MKHPDQEMAPSIGAAAGLTASGSRHDAASAQSATVSAGGSLCLQPSLLSLPVDLSLADSSHSTLR